MTHHFAQRVLAVAVAWFLAAPGLCGQTLLPIAPVKPEGLPFLRSYKGVTVPPLRNSSSSRLHSMIRGGTLYLSVHDALALAIENSLDLEIARYDVARAPWDVQRAQSGGALRGVTGTTGGTIRLGSGQGVAGSQSSSGGGAGGGTSSLAGAALIQQIGPVTPQLDPIETFSAGVGHQTSIQTQLVQSGANYFAYDGRSYTDQLSQGLVSGGVVRYTYQGSYLNEAVPLDVLNPTSYINTGFLFAHNLLNGFGVKVNDRFIRLAQKRAANIDLTFQSRLMILVTTVLNLYWDYSVASDDLKFKQRDSDLAQELLRNTGIQIAAGAIPAIEQVRAQSNVALQEQALRVAQNNALQRENALKDVLTYHGRPDPELDSTHIVAVDPLRVPDVSEIPPLSAMLETARKNRPDVIIARRQEEIAATTAYGTANGVLPSLRIIARASNTGQAGTAVPGQSPTEYFVGGAGNALDQVLRRNFPNESAAISFNGKMENSLAQADNAIDVLTHRQSQLSRQKASSDLARDLALQRLALEQAATRYKSAIDSRQLIEQLLQGEEKKWQAGTSTLAAIVSARRDLANAQSSELAGAAAFLRSQIALDQALGLTLERNDIRLDDALRSAPDEANAANGANTGGK
jgi:outer membrane protein TolC